MKYTYWPVTATTSDRYDYLKNAHPMDEYLKKTTLLNFTHSRLVDLVERRGWLNLPKQQQVSELFDYVKNEIVFGYNKVCNVPASRVLLDGYGCGNSKSILLMALLRICDIPCRFHAVTIDKKLHKSVTSRIAYYFIPRNVVASWVEIYFESNWVKLEGYIFDHIYLKCIQQRIENVEGSCFDSSIVSQGTQPYRRIKSINHDYGIFDCPDNFYQQYTVNLTMLKVWLFKHLVRNQTNNKLSQIRRGYDGMQETLNVSRAG
jgi:hypothetical protein